MEIAVVLSFLSIFNFNYHILFISGSLFQPTLLSYGLGLGMQLFLRVRIGGSNE